MTPPTWTAASPGWSRTLDTDGLLVGTDLSKDRQERGAHHARFLSLTPDTLGGVRIKGYATVEEAELVKTCLLPLAAPVVLRARRLRRRPRHRLPRPARPADRARLPPTPLPPRRPRPPRRRGAGCGTPWSPAAASRPPTSCPTPTPPARTHHHRHRGPPRPARRTRARRPGLLPSGEPCPRPRSAGSLVTPRSSPPSCGTDSQVLDVGRTQRLVTPGIWTALVLRDQHCAFPGCTRLPIACDAHHIQHWADGGATSPGQPGPALQEAPHHHPPDPVAGRPRPSTPDGRSGSHHHLVDDRDRFTYRPASRPPPMVA